MIVFDKLLRLNRLTLNYIWMKKLSSKINSENKNKITLNLDFHVDWLIELIDQAW